MFILRSQHCHSCSFTITGVLLTDYSLYKLNAHTNEAIPVFAFSKNVSQAIFFAGGGGWWRPSWTFAAPFSNSLSLDFHSRCPFTAAAGRDNRYVRLSRPSHEAMYVHPDPNGRYENRALIVYTVCTSQITKVVVPLQSSVRSHIKIPQYLHDESPQTKVQCLFMSVIYRMVMKCMLSFSDYMEKSSSSPRTPNQKNRGVPM